MKPHPLEQDEQQRQYFERIRTGTHGGASAYRTAVLALTPSLPTWAQPLKRGRKPKPAGTV